MTEHEEMLEYMWTKLKQRGPPDSQEDPGTFCLSDYYGWMLSPQGLNPCQLAAIILDECQDQGLGRSPYWIDPLWPSGGLHLYPAVGSDQASSCTCNPLVYNLIQACGYCQHALGDAPLYYQSFSQFTGNCSYISSVFPIVPDQAMPGWALIDTGPGPLAFSTIWTLTHEADQGYYGTPASAVAPPGPSTRFAGDNVNFTSSLVATRVTSAVATSSSLTPAEAQESAYTYPPHRPMSNVIVGVVAAIIVILAVGITALLCLRWRRKRKERQGTRLGSTTDLLYTGPEPAMQEKKSGSASLMPSESLNSTRSRSSMSTDTSFTGTAETRRSSTFTDNSASTESTSHDFRAYLTRTARLHADAPTLSTMTFSSSATSETDDRSTEVGGDDFSLSLSLTSTRHSGGVTNEDASPFADVHRAESIITLSSTIHSSADHQPYNGSLVQSLRPGPRPAPPAARQLSGHSAVQLPAGNRDSVASHLSMSSTGAVYAGDDGSLRSTAR